MDTLKAILEDIRSDIDFDKEKKLIDDSILDSFDIIAIVTELNNAYGININVNHLVPDNLNSIEAMWELVTKLQNS